MKISGSAITFGCQKTFMGSLSVAYVQRGQCIWKLQDCNAS